MRADRPRELPLISKPPTPQRERLQTPRITTAFKAAPLFPSGRMRPSRLPSETGWTERTGHSLLIRYYDRVSAMNLCPFGGDGIRLLGRRASLSDAVDVSVQVAYVASAGACFDDA